MVFCSSPVLIIPDEICEAFNFKRIPYNQYYYLKNLSYTDGKDTIILIPEVKDNSKESEINFANPDCNPVYSIDYSSKKGNKLNLIYSFEYYPFDKFTEMNIIINNSEKSIKIFPTSNDSIYKIEKFKLLYYKDSINMIKYGIIKNMFLDEFETILGEKWSLLK